MVIALCLALSLSITLCHFAVIVVWPITLFFSVFSIYCYCRDYCCCVSRPFTMCERVQREKRERTTNLLIELKQTKISVFGYLYEIHMCI